MKITKRKMVVFAFIIFVVIGLKKIFNLNGIYTIQQAANEKAGLENVYFISQIVAAIFVIIGSVIAVWQYILTTNAERNKIEKDNIQKAISLSEYYKDNVLNKYAIIKHIYRETGILSILNECDSRKMKEFDTFEVKDVILPEQKRKIEEINKSQKLIKAVIETEIIFGIDLHIKQFAEIEYSEDKHTLKIKNVNVGAVYREYSNNIISLTLNNLEYFAMHFTHGVADESVIYQSLHQSYLELVRMLYYEIASINVEGCHNYYTNIIDLYNNWNARSEKREADIIYKRRKTIDRGAVAKKGL